MKISAIIVSFLFIITAALAADATIESFTARSDGRNIIVEWRCSKEADVVRYEIERSTANSQDFKKIGTLTVSTSQPTYRFVDENAFLRGGSGNPGVIQSGTLYVYRLKIIGSDEKSTYTNSIPVLHAVSSVRRTWGMIKEMFR